MYNVRYTPLDYAKINDHGACVDLLSKAGGVSVESVRELAAAGIQAAFRGYRYCGAAVKGHP